VADGSSTDGSVEVLERNADKLRWWVSEPDRGQADAVNKCLARVQGEIIGWVNSDDLLLPGAVSAVSAAFAANPRASMVFGDVNSIDERGQTINQMRYGAWGLDELMTFHIIGQPGVFFRRSALEQAGMLDLDYHFLLDHQLWLRLAQTGEMHYLPQALAAARFHAQAKNIAQAARFGEEAYRIVAWMQTQPALAERFARLNKRIWAGVHRFNARYLLDGGQPGAALKSYGRSLAAHPPTALQEWHRMVYAGLSLAGLGRLKPLYYRIRAALRRKTNPEVYH
jgi:GT2 family glycosyltransferase